MSRERSDTDEDRFDKYYHLVTSVVSSDGPRADGNVPAPDDGPSKIDDGGAAEGRTRWMSRWILVAAAILLATGVMLGITHYVRREPITEASVAFTRSFGPINIGFSPAQAEAATGRRFVPVGGNRENPDCYYIEQEGGPKGVAFMVEKGRIVRYDVSNPHVFTSGGAKVGDDETAVLKLYRGRLVVSPNHYDEAWHELEYVSPDPKEAGFALVFTSDGKKVRGFQAGSKPAVNYVEGCL